MVKTMRLANTNLVRTCTHSTPPTHSFACTLKTKKHNPNQHYLSIKPRSPRKIENLSIKPKAEKIYQKWMYYQGITNWEGMLDPLDDNLRCEIMRYGQFVEAAYRACDLDPSSSSYATCRYSKGKLLENSGFSGSGYRVCKKLFATSGIELPGWAWRVPSWMVMQSSCIGYVAVCQDRREISRIGRRDVVIALRGTATGMEWLENMRATLAPLPDADSEPCSEPDSEPMVENGFLSLYTSSFGDRPSLQKQVRDEIGRIVAAYGGDEPLSFTFTGHSLGAALATLAAADVSRNFGNSNLVTVISFAGPRVGNRSFRCRLEEQGTKILRIVNADDPVTKVPGFVLDPGDFKEEERRRPSRFAAEATSTFARLVQKVVEDTRWVYADVGCELRLSSRDSPYDINIATCHGLQTYLLLVGGFVSSNYPLRATASELTKKDFCLKKL